MSPGNSGAIEEEALADDELECILGGNGDDSDQSADDEFRAVPDDDELPNAQLDLPADTPHIHDVSDSGQRQRSATPQWLAQDYADTRERLAAEMKKNASKKPTCYERGSFVDGCPFPFFTAESKIQCTPRDFYRPSYFVWLPHLLVKRIPCPACKAAQREPVPLLRCNGWPKRPRRVVDLEDCIFVIGYRYNCTHQDCRKTYQSWSPALLSVLPPAVSAQFTHHLTYRSGLTDRLVALMRGCFLHGIGPGPFANMIRTNHIRRYEQLHLQYLEMVNARLQSSFVNLLAKFAPFGLFDDRDGYAGFIPSANYFRQFYVRFLQSHASEIDQYTSMLSAKVLAIDHSHKASCVFQFMGNE